MYTRQKRKRASKRAAQVDQSFGPLAPWLRRTIRDKRRARSGVKCTLDESWVSHWSSVTHCEVTGLPFALGRPGRPGAVDPLAPSLDRRDSSLPYTPENTRVVSYFANVARNAWSDAEFRLLVLATASNMVHR